ncbi:Dihydropteroate synthase [invertebrate metagenome]|uniref:dihydropteroate synthase n=1 Tax=invertebrate metagenome TaxID=1711999 RepID=A0A484H6F1_9ZZZZ
MDRSHACSNVSGPSNGHAKRAKNTFYLVPIGLLSGDIAEIAVKLGRARLLVGGPLAFTACEVVARQGETIRSAVLPLDEVQAWAARENATQWIHTLLDRLSSRRPPFSGFSFERPRLMGVVNVTPDSFSDGGTLVNPRLALAHALRLKAAGADIIDVGGESTRPGACSVAPAEEIERVVPVIQALAERGVVTSIDTRHAAVMAAALEAGAAIVNDVTALTGDPLSLPLVASRKIPVILTHMQGEPHTMQRNPQYSLAPLDIYDMLAERLTVCLRAGLTRAGICLDPGIGFGKTVRHNLEILGRLAVLHTLGCCLMLGVSRKSFIAGVSAAEPPGARLPGSLMAALAGLDQGIGLIRVHDVAETFQAVNVWQAMRTATGYCASNMPATPSPPARAVRADWQACVPH